MSPPVEPPWPNPFAPTAETNNRTANEIASAARRPCPPKIVVPRLRRPPNKFGISDKPDPMPELEKAEFPKPEAPKPETPKRESPKFPVERPEENDEKDENREGGSRFAEKRFEVNPAADEYWFDAVARFDPNDENPERFRPKELSSTHELTTHPLPVNAHTLIVYTS